MTAPARSALFRLPPCWPPRRPPRRKLRLWDVADKEIDAIIQAGKSPKTIVFRSSATRHLEEKMVVQGASVQPGMKLLRIADHTKLWLEAQVYEEQVPLLALGQTL